jgi:uncharacterized membrane protein
MKMKSRLLSGVIVCACIGVALSAYAWLHNYGIVSGGFCTVDQTFNCDIVNKGPYGRLFGISVGLLGVIGYGLIAIAAWLRMRSLEDKGLLWFLTAAVAGALGFSLYLTGIEAFVLHAWCLVCLTSQTVVLILVGLVIGLWRSDRHAASSIPSSPSILP